MGGWGRGGGVENLRLPFIYPKPHHNLRFNWAKNVFASFQIRILVKSILVAALFSGKLVI